MSEFDAIEDFLPDKAVPLGMIRFAFFLDENAEREVRWKADGEIPIELTTYALEVAKIHYLQEDLDDE